MGIDTIEITMRKIFVFFVVMIIGSCTLSAQHYRGFVNLDASNPLGSSDHFSNDGFLLGVSTTHGIQLNRFYIGAGVGIQVSMDVADGEKVVPVFADFRYDFFGVHSTNFFISAKVGYNLWIDTYLVPEGFCGVWGLDFHPSIGFRFRIKPNMGINVALNIMPVNVREVEYHSRASREYFKPRMGISIGVDF